MTRRGEPPDIRDWAILSMRIRLGFLFEVVAVLAGASLIAVGRVSLALGLFAVSLIALALAFGSRRPWWPPADAYDPLAAHGRRWVFVSVFLILVTVGLVAAGVLSV